MFFSFADPSSWPFLSGVHEDTDVDLIRTPGSARQQRTEPYRTAAQDSFFIPSGYPNDIVGRISM